LETVIRSRSGAGELNAEEGVEAGWEVAGFNEEAAAIFFDEVSETQSDTGADVGLGGEDGSKMRERFSGSMPWPLSAMERVALPWEQAASMR